MAANKSKGEKLMAVTDKRREWLKENTVFIGLRLQKSTDADILDYLKDKANQTEIKRALRLLIETEKGEK